MNEESRHTEVRPRRDPETIRQEIRRTRGEMDGTVDELVDRLSVGNLVDEVWQRFRHRSGNLDGVLKDHPIPLALIGLGLGWLVVEQATGDSNGEASGRHDRGQARYSGGYAGSQGSTWERDRDDGSDEGLRDRMGHTASDVKHRAADLKDQVTDRAADLKGNVTDRASDLKDDLTERAADIKHRVGDTVSSVKESASHLTDSGRDAGRRAGQSLKSMLTDHPLTAGGIAFGLGLASGLAVPSTSFEDRELGETSDRLKEKARSVGRTAAEAAGDMGQKAAHTVVEEAKHLVDETASTEDPDSSDGPDDASTDVGTDSPSGKGGGPGAPRAAL